MSQKVPAENMETERYIVIIGAMKSGTTTLFSMLARHPRISPAHPKEPGFFAFDEIHEKGWDWYHDLFDFDADRHDWRLEASTDYTKHPFVGDVADRMAARTGARFKLIYLMRHPLRRIESHARHVQRTKAEIGREISARPDHGLDAGLSLPSLAMTRYAAQIDVYRAAWEEGNLHLVTLEDLEAAPDQTLSGIWNFLDLDPAPEVIETGRQNVAGTRRALHPVWRMVARQGWLMRLGRMLLPDIVRMRIKGRFRRSTKVEGRFVLTPPEEAALIALLAPDLRRLRDIYGVDVERIWRLDLEEADAVPRRAEAPDGTLSPNRV